MKKILFLLLICCASCMGNFGDLNPVRERVIESLSGNLGTVSDITIGSTTYTFSVCGDVHSGGEEVEVFDRILTATSSSSDEFLVVLGDLADWGKRNEFEAVKNHMDRYTFPHGVYTVLGNHDIFWDGWEIYKELFGPSVYTWASENARFVVLDTANSTLGMEQLDWLDELLSANTKQYTFIFSHVGPYTGMVSWFYKLSSQEEIYRLEHILRKHNVNMMFSGHLHTFKNNIVRGIHYVITGGAGGTLFRSGPNHYVRVHVSPSGIEIEKIEL